MVLVFWDDAVDKEARAKPHEEEGSLNQSQETWVPVLTLSPKDSKSPNTCLSILHGPCFLVD